MRGWPCSLRIERRKRRYLDTIARAVVLRRVIGQAGYIRILNKIPHGTPFAVQVQVKICGAVGRHGDDGKLLLQTTANAQRRCRDLSGDVNYVHPQSASY